MRSKLKIPFLLVLLPIIIFSLFGCDRGVTHRYLEIGITLPSNFEEYDPEGAYDASFTDGELIVGISRISFDAAVNDGIPATLSPLSFAKYYLIRTETEAEIKEHGYIPYYMLRVDEGVGYEILTSFYRTDYAYFVIYFVKEAPIDEKDLGSILKMIDTVFYETPKGE